MVEVVIYDEIRASIVLAVILFLPDEISFVIVIF